MVYMNYMIFMLLQYKNTKEGGIINYFQISHRSSVPDLLNANCGAIICTYSTKKEKLRVLLIKRKSSFDPQISYSWSAFGSQSFM